MARGRFPGPLVPIDSSRARPPLSIPILLTLTHPALGPAFSVTSTTPAASQRSIPVRDPSLWLPKAPPGPCPSATAKPQGCREGLVFQGQRIPSYFSPWLASSAVFSSTDHGRNKRFAGFRWNQRLKHIPSPFPSIPPSIQVHFLQLRCWKHLGMSLERFGKREQWGAGPGACRWRTQSGKFPCVELGLWSNRFQSRPLYLCQCKNSSLGHLFGSHG